MVAVSGEAVFERMEQVRQLISELEPILQSLMLNDSTMIDGLAQMLGSLQQMQRRTEDRLAVLADDIHALSALVARSNAPIAAAEPVACDRNDPEISLLAALLPSLPNPMLVDVGANIGHVAETLVSAGFEVFAFEPYPDSFAALSQRAAQFPRLHAFPYAIGATDGEAELLIARDRSEAGKWDTSLFHSTVRHPMLDDLAFGETVQVTLRSLASLVAERVLPANASVLKIDTEGADLEVIRGSGDLTFDIITLEFWDDRHPFGREGHGALPDQVRMMRAKGYPWHIALYRLDEEKRQGFFCNLQTSLPKSWGNSLYFREFSMFSRAADWCGRAFG